MFNNDWIRGNAWVAAAIELVRTPSAANNSALQDKICRSYGVFLDKMTDDEILEFESFIKSFI